MTLWILEIKEGKKKQKTRPCNLVEYSDLLLACHDKASLSAVKFEVTEDLSSGDAIFKWERLVEKYELRNKNSLMSYK